MTMVPSHLSASKVARYLQQRQRQLAYRVQWFSAPVTDPDSGLSAIVNDYFDVLGLKRDFQVSEDVLRRKYRNLMIEFHPDKHGNKSLIERQDTETRASGITQAYEVIREPHSRAQHLLELVGKEIAESESSDMLGNEFLMQIMEVREDIESTAPNRMGPLLREAEGYIDGLCEALASAFDAEDYQSATVLSAKLKYWARIKEAIKEKFDDDHEDDASNLEGPTTISTSK